MKAVTLPIITALISSPVAAQDSIQLALELGSVLGSEQACGLKYDQEAIRAFIDKRVNADDMGFAGQLDLFTRGAARGFDRMTASAKTAHCAQTSRVAKSFGFIK